MRIGLIGGSVAIALVALLSSVAPSHAYIPQPWCSDGLSNNPGGNDCAFSSYHQCTGKLARLHSQSMDRAAADSARLDCFYVSASS
jgi:hypothetical protein